ncbi:UDP-glucosyltransferase 2-like [Battus philenor]|uniref:UDP-glucosyltransferase 2-like n=1 Tax=Battus philenor TaxID=42288 RepID=UPI0035D12376
MAAEAAAVLLVLGLACCCSAGSVLVVFPVPCRSHGILGSSIVDILLQAGHQVTYVTPFPVQRDAGGLTVADISSALLDAADTEHLDIALLADRREPAHRLLQQGGELVRRALRQPALRELLNDPSATFDAVIADWFYSGLLAPLAAVYDCPLIWYSGGDASWQSLQLVHEPSAAAYSAVPQFQKAPSLPFTVGEKIQQQLLQMYLAAWTYYYTSSVERAASHAEYSAALQLRARTPRQYEVLVHNASLLLINCHAPLAQTLPLSPNVKYVGGHHLSTTTESLPRELQELLDRSTHGVIYFSLGSNLKSRDLPENIKRGLLQTFGRLQQTVIWKLEEEVQDLPSNVHVLEWAPQQSLLNHPKLRLFITQGGLLSIMEATQYGVPIVGVPILGDQFFNVDRAVQRGCGVKVNFSPELPLKILEAVHDILANTSYRTNAKLASSIFRRRLADPQTELLHWVELVMETRGAGFLRSPALDVPAVQRLNLDVLLLLALILWFLSKVVKVINVHLKNDTEENSLKKND